MSEEEDHFQLSLLQKIGNVLLECGLTPWRLKQLGIVILVIIGISAVVLFFQPKSNSRSPKNAERTSKTLEDSDNFDAPKERTEDLPHDDPDRQRVVLERSLANQKKFVLTCIENGIDCEPEKQKLISIVESCNKHDRQELSDAANFSLCSVGLLEFSVYPVEECLQATRDLLLKHRPTYLGYPDRCRELVNILTRTDRLRGHNKWRDQCAVELGNLLLSSEDSVDQKAGEGILEFFSFAKFKLDDLEQRIRFNARDATESVAGVLEQLRLHPETMPNRWRRIIRVCEAFASISNTEKFEQTWNSLSEIADTIPDSNPLAKEVPKLLERQKIRVAAVGKTFEIFDEQSDGDTAQMPIRGYTLIVFSNQTQQSVDAVKQLANTLLSSNKNCQIILVFKKESMPSSTGLARLLEANLLIASEEAAEKYFEQIPVDFFPEIVLVDGKDRILGTNMSPGQVDTTLADIEQERRKKILKP